MLSRIGQGILASLSCLHGQWGGFLAARFMGMRQFVLGHCRFLICIDSFLSQSALALSLSLLLLHSSLQPFSSAIGFFHARDDTARDALAIWRQLAGGSLRRVREPVKIGQSREQLALWMRSRRRRRLPSGHPLGRAPYSSHYDSIY